MTHDMYMHEVGQKLFVLKKEVDEIKPYQEWKEMMISTKGYRK